MSSGHHRSVGCTTGGGCARKARTLFPDHVAITSPGGCKAAGKADWRSGDFEADHWSENLFKFLERVGQRDVEFVVLVAAAKYLFRASWRNF